TKPTPQLAQISTIPSKQGTTTSTAILLEPSESCK
ncbi:unnamed protein product, partial [Adineta steineri]